MGERGRGRGIIGNRTGDKEVSSVYQKIWKIFLEKQIRAPGPQILLSLRLLKD